MCYAERPEYPKVVLVGLPFDLAAIAALFALFVVMGAPSGTAER